MLLTQFLQINIHYDSKYIDRYIYLEKYLLKLSILNFILITYLFQIYILIILKKIKKSLSI